MSCGIDEREWLVGVLRAIDEEPRPRVVEQCEHCNKEIFENQEMVDIGIHSYHFECCLEKMRERPEEILEEMGIDVSIA